ncbi:MAG: hypothetical protein AB7O59_00560 [Pirellulales bacterium]
MKKRIALVFALVATVLFAVGEAEARGGRGGARPGGGRPGGNFSRGPNVGSSFGNSNFGTAKPSDGAIHNGAANQVGKQFGTQQFGKAPASLFGQKLQTNGVQANGAQSHVGAAQNRASQLQANFSSRIEPFSPAWYAGHPQAWGYAHPHADAWAVASLGAAAAWLGWPAYAAEDSTVYTADDGTTDESTTDESTTDESTTNDATTADDTAATEDAAAEQGEQAPQEIDAAQLAAKGAVELPSDTEFLPLGVFAIAPANQQEATAVLQISVSKQGILRGSYCDLLTDQGQTVVGAVDKDSQRAAWTIGDDGRVVFETTLANLTGSEGPVALHFPTGGTREYTLSRFENKTADAQ